LKPVETLVARACFQRLKPTCDATLSNIAFSFNLRPYVEENNNMLVDPEKPGALQRPRWGGAQSDNISHVDI
jgi:hypothetical protein